MPRTACESSALISVTAMTPLEDLRAWMAAHNVDAAYVTKPVSIAYLTGFHAEPYERLMALTVRPDRATLIVPALEHEKAAGHAAGRLEIVSWRDGEDAYALVRAGTTTGAVDAAARQVIEAVGMGDRFFHRTGHGLGLEAHEDPSLDPGSETVLEVGMVFTVEPGIYIPGWGGVRIEDDVVVEADGCRLLTKADRSLRTVPRG